jgi:hypothetical protein
MITCDVSVSIELTEEATRGPSSAKLQAARSSSADALEVVAYRNACFYLSRQQTAVFTYLDNKQKENSRRTAGMCITGNASHISPNIMTF